MFAKALTSVRNFTFPVGFLIRREGSQKVESSLGAFFVINRDGWAVTASHVAELLLGVKRHQEERRSYESQAADVRDDPTLSDSQKKRRLRALKPNPNWIVNVSQLWLLPNFGPIQPVARDVRGDRAADLAVLRLEPFDPSAVTEYPVFRNAAKEPVVPGTSLCRYGFPFHHIQATFDEETGRFAPAPNAFPVPGFPIEGIHTRNIVMRVGNAGREVLNLETSSPGLKGQSGGPIVDVQGRVCGIQSRTKHWDLGFSPRSKHDGEERVERQFLNAGWGPHVDEVRRFLDRHEIRYDLSPGNG